MKEVQKWGLKNIIGTGKFTQNDQNQDTVVAKISELQILGETQGIRAEIKGVI